MTTPTLAHAAACPSPTGKAKATKPANRLPGNRIGIQVGVRTRSQGAPGQRVLTPPAPLPLPNYLMAELHPLSPKARYDHAAESIELQDHLISQVERGVTNADLEAQLGIPAGSSSRLFQVTQAIMVRHGHALIANAAKVEAHGFDLIAQSGDLAGNKGRALHTIGAGYVASARATREAARTALDRSRSVQIEAQKLSAKRQQDEARRQAEQQVAKERADREAREAEIAAIKVAMQATMDDLPGDIGARVLEMLSATHFEAALSHEPEWAKEIFDKVVEEASARGVPAKPDDVASDSMDRDLGRDEAHEPAPRLAQKTDRPGSILEQAAGLSANQATRSSDNQVTPPAQSGNRATVHTLIDFTPPSPSELRRLTPSEQTQVQRIRANHGDRAWLEYLTPIRQRLAEEDRAAEVRELREAERRTDALYRWK